MNKKEECRLRKYEIKFIQVDVDTAGSETY